MNEEDEIEENGEEEEDFEAHPDPNYGGFDEETGKDAHPVDETHSQHEGHDEFQEGDEEEEEDSNVEAELPTVHEPEHTEEHEQDNHGPEVHEEEIKPEHHYPTHEEKDNRCRGDDSVQCTGSNVFICSDQICDGVVDCPNEADEEHCDEPEPQPPKRG